MRELFPEWKEVSCPTTYHGCYHHEYGVVGVSGVCVEIRYYYLEDEAGKRLPDVVQRKRRVVVVELEA